MLAGNLKAPMGETLGFDLVEVERGHVVFEGTPDRSVYNPLGSVHGGYAATLLDSACGIAVAFQLGPSRGHTTLEFKVSVSARPQRASGTVRATGRARLGRAARGLCRGDPPRWRGRLCATATSTLLVFDIERADLAHCRYEGLQLRCPQGCAEFARDARRCVHKVGVRVAPAWPRLGAVDRRWFRTAPPAARQARNAGAGRLVLLASLAALGALATNIMLPAFPAMARDLGVAPGELALTLSGFFVVFAVGQLFVGPLPTPGAAPFVFGGLAVFVSGQHRLRARASCRC